MFDKLFFSLSFQDAVEIHTHIHIYYIYTLLSFQFDLVKKRKVSFLIYKQIIFVYIVI